MNDLEKQLPAVPNKLLASEGELKELCAHLRGAGRFAFDTEFIGERSYRPQLCLIQVATTERVALVDPFALPDLMPLWEVMADEGVEKVGYAADQDLAIVFQQSGLRPANVFDAQIAGGMIGLGYPLAYWRLVELYCGVSLSKAHTFSAWDRRPLSGAQFAYAVDDVRYLPRVYEELVKRLRELGHEGWLKTACEELCADAAKRVDPQMVYMKLKGAQLLSPVQLAVLRELAAVREQLAYEHDVPVRGMLRDEVVVEIAQRLPRTEADLLKVRGLMKEDITSYGELFLEATERGRAVPEELRPRLPLPVDDSLEVKRVAEVLWSAAQVICLGQQVWPGLVTSLAEMASLARRVVQGKTLEKHVLMTGWHRECLGRHLVDLLEGKLEMEVGMKERALMAKFRRRGE